MFNNKVKEYKILNKNLPLFNLLCLLATLYLGTIVNYWYFLFLILVVLISLNIRPNKWQILICVGIIGIYIPMILFLNKFSLFYVLSNLCHTQTVRIHIFSYLDSIYTSETSSFIKLILFGKKSQEVIVFYKQTIDLGIVWLISIGGFHISFLSRSIYKTTKKVWKITKWIDVFIIFSYSFLLNFSYSSLRVLSILLLNPFFNKFSIEKYNKLGFIGILFCLLNPSCFQSYSFLLSFIGVTSAYFVSSLNIENKLINSFLIGVLGFASTIPFVVNMNHKISLFTFINSFIFSYVFAYLFLYFLIFSWMPFMAIVHHWIIIGCYAIMGNISYLNIYIYTTDWKPYICFAYYSVLYALTKLLYLIVYYNKI